MVPTVTLANGKRATGAAAYNIKLFKFFTHESGEHQGDAIDRAHFELILRNTLQNLKFPKSPFVTQLWRKFAMNTCDKATQAAMSTALAKTLRKVMLKGHSKVSQLEFNAILDDLCAKLFQKLCPEGKKSVSPAAAAHLAAIMRSGGYSDKVFKQSIKKFRGKTVARKDFTNFLVSEVARFQCSFPTRYPVARAVHFLAFAIVDDDVVKTVRQLTELRPGKQRKKKKAGKGTDTKLNALRIEANKTLYDGMLQSSRAVGGTASGAGGRLEKKWFSSMMKSDPFETLVVDGVMHSFQQFADARSKKMRGEGFANMVGKFERMCYRRLRDEASAGSVDRTATEQVLQMLTGVKPTQAQQHLRDYVREELVRQAGGDEGAAQKAAADGMTSDTFCSFLSRAWAHEADVGNPARAHARYFGVLFLLAFEDATVYAMKQNRLEMQSAYKEEVNADVSLLPKGAADDAKGAPAEGGAAGGDGKDWREFEYGLDLDFGDNSSSDTADEKEQSPPEQKLPEIKPKRISKAKRRRMRKRLMKKKKRQEKEARLNGWDWRHDVVPSKNDRYVSKAYRSSFAVFQTHQVRPDGSSEYPKAMKDRLRLPSITNRYSVPAGKIAKRIALAKARQERREKIKRMKEAKSRRRLEARSESIASKMQNKVKKNPAYATGARPNGGKV